MYFLQNFFIWIRKYFIRILLGEYPNACLKASSIINNKRKKNIHLISSTDNFWVSKSMYKKWQFFSEYKGIELNIYSNKQVNAFMKDNFKDDLIYEIYKKSILPVQKIDLFRICCVYLYGGIWLDLKSEVDLGKVLQLYNKYNSNGILLYEPRQIEVVTFSDNKQTKSYANVIHNGFFFLPKGSLFLKKLLFKIKKDYLYFQDIVFNYPKDGIMNLTGPHQFTRTYYDINSNSRPKLVSHSDIKWVFSSKYGEFLSPLKSPIHYSSLKKLKIIDSRKSLNLK